MADEVLFQVKEVQLSLPIAAILSTEDKRVNCEDCGEEIFNEREIEENGRILCRPCANQIPFWP
jgi:formylmethanofuran dehydrogenase subunit E